MRLSFLWMGDEGCWNGSGDVSGSGSARARDPFGCMEWMVSFGCDGICVCDCDSISLVCGCVADSVSLSGSNSSIRSFDGGADSRYS